VKTPGRVYVLIQHAYTNVDDFLELQKRRYGLEMKTDFIELSGF